MLTVKLEENGADALKELGVNASAGSLVMAMRDGGELMGVGTMRLFDGFAALDGIYLKDEYNTFDLGYGIGKSMLNFMDLHGIRYAVSNSEDLKKLLAALRFKPSCEFEDTDDAPGDWAYCLNLNGYFTSNC